MPTLQNPDDLEAIRRRLRSLTPEDTARWGTLTRATALCHLADATRVAVGDLTAQPRSTFITRTLVKWLVVKTSMQAPPGRAKTAPEMLTSRPTTWAADRTACEELLDRVAAGRASAEHPAFGRLTGPEWATLGWKHFDHHLRQFGR